MEKCRGCGQRGIAATALAIGGLILLTVATIATSIILQKNRQIQKSRAEEAEIRRLEIIADVRIINPYNYEPHLNRISVTANIPSLSGCEELEYKGIPLDKKEVDLSVEVVLMCDANMMGRTVKIAAQAYFPQFEDNTSTKGWVTDVVNQTVTGGSIRVNLSLNFSSLPTPTPQGGQQVQDTTPPNPPKNLQATKTQANGREVIKFSWSWGGDNSGGVGYCKRYEDGTYAASRNKNLDCKPNKDLASPFWWHIVAEKADGNTIVLFKCYNNRIQEYKIPCRI